MPLGEICLECIATNEESHQRKGPLPNLSGHQISRQIPPRAVSGPGTPPFRWIRTWNRSPIPSGWISVLSCSRAFMRSEEHTSELQSHLNLVCRLLLEKKKEDVN